ncbi:MAG: KpsF/GutQ family sugar-phosphate isomerase [Candidatus Dadabacteria bacterium]|nr:MAG: KpsF/GutQ family sugar-phosphate isomerase [Candidatus Dadabacteria bacterium]
MSALDTARRVLRIEADTLTRLAASLGPEFDRAVDLLESCRGKVVLTGMGKSGIVCRKIAATFASTGTPSFFLHPAEGVHGDLGILARGDVVVAASNSGETEELVEILPVIRRLELGLVAITGNPRSTLARRADVVLHVPVEEEACPLNLAPMASTTATLALGDALAAALMVRKGFTAEDFARFHPAGALGRRLVLQVDDLMHDGDAVPRVGAQAPMPEVLVEMTSKRLGLTGVFDPEGRLLGVVTDGDLRRGLEQIPGFLGKRAREVMTPNPKRVPSGTLAIDALRTMERHAITALFVTEPDDPDRVRGVVHIHDLVKAGLR